MSTPLEVKTHSTGVGQRIRMRRSGSSALTTTSADAPYKDQCHVTDLPVSSTSLPFENQNRLVIEGSMKGAIDVRQITTDQHFSNR